VRQTPDPVSTDIARNRISDTELSIALRLVTSRELCVGLSKVHLLVLADLLGGSPERKYGDGRYRGLTA
jgi:hypothetical protein